MIFGVGKRQWVSVKINWPDGKAQVLAHQAVNETILFDQKDAPDDTVKEKIVPPLFTEIKNDPALFIHVEDDYNDFKREPLLPHRF